MKIAVIGAGAIGSVIAGYLAKSGQDVLLVGRPEQVDIIKRKGLLIKGIRGEDTINLKIEEKLDQAYDLIIFTVKTQDIETAYRDNHEFLDYDRYTDNKVIMTTQNGVQADSMVSVHFEKEMMISSIVMFGATYIQPGEVILNFDGDWIIGKPYVRNDAQVTEISNILKAAFPIVLSDDIMGMKWLKLFINFNNCLPALIGKSMQETFLDLDFCRLSIMLLKEGFSIVQEAGIQLVSLPNFPIERIEGIISMPIDQAVEIIHKTLTSLSKEPLYGSILQSIMRKKISEIEYINGEVVLLAKHINQRALLNQKVVDLVHKVEEKGRFFNSDDIKKEFSLGTE